MQRDTLENVVAHCLVVCELLARENRGLAKQNLEIGVASFYPDAKPEQLEMLVSVVGRVMRESGLVIEYDGYYFWRGDTAPNVPEESLN